MAFFGFNPTQPPNPFASFMQGFQNQMAPPPPPPPPPDGDMFGAGDQMPWGQLPWGPPGGQPGGMYGMPGLPGAPGQFGGAPPQPAAVPHPAGPTQANPPAAAPPVQRTPPAAGSAPPNLGYVDPASQVFEDPQTAVWNVLKNQGINVYSSSPIIQGVLSRANDLVMNNIIPGIAQGTIDPANPAALTGALTDAVNRFLHNQGVFYGSGAGGSGASVLNSLFGQGQAGENGGGTEQQRFIASILDNPQTLAALGKSLLGSAANPTVSKVLTAPVSNIPAEFQRLQATTPGGLPAPGAPGYTTLLQQWLQSQQQGTANPFVMAP